MSSEVSAMQRLYIECNQDNPDLTKIDEYIDECRYKNEDMNKLIPDNRWPLNSCNPRKMTPLQVACRFGHHEIVEILINSMNNFQSSVDVNILGKEYSMKTALHFACERNCPLIVRALLKHPNIEVNKVDEYNSVPLATACCRNYKSVIMDFLMHPDIQLTLQDNYGYIPLHIACVEIMKDTDIIQMLIGHQQQKHRISQLNIRDWHDRTALHIACHYTNHAAVVEILKHVTVIDINATDEDGRTALCNACSRSYINSKLVKHH